MSNRNFDSRTIIHMLNAQNVAQSVAQLKNAGKSVINNPQNSSASQQVILDYKTGSQAVYNKSLSGTYTTDACCNK
jgi:hypothetical protein